MKPFNIFSATLCCNLIFGSHTGERIHEETVKVLSFFEIESRVFKYVHDNGSNLVKASKLNIIQSQILEVGSKENNNKENAEENNAILNDFDDLFEDDSEFEDDDDPTNEEVDANKLNESLQDFNNILIKFNKVPIRCFNHTIQLIIKDSLHVITTIETLLKKVFVIAKKSRIKHEFVEFMDRKCKFFLAFIK